MACDVDEREPMRISFARAWSLNDYCIDTVCRVHVACIHMWAGSDPSAGHGSLFRGYSNTVASSGARGWCTGTRVFHGWRVVLE